MHGERYVAVFVDGFSRFYYAVPIKQSTASATLDAFRQFIRDVGRPAEVLTDWGSEFHGAFEHYCVDHDIRMRKSCPHEHWQAGLVERANR